MNFHDLLYLESGNPRQRAAFVTLVKFSVFENLSDFTPFLAGTLPIGVDIDSSDLDILCCFGDADTFEKSLINQFHDFNGFCIRKVDLRSRPAIVANFLLDDFQIEVFGQKRPVEQQEAYRHLVVEHALLLHYGENLRQNVIALKKKGMKTEPAFAQVLGLRGNPYEELLNVKIPLH